MFWEATRGNIPALSNTLFYAADAHSFYSHKIHHI